MINNDGNKSRILQLSLDHLAESDPNVLGKD